MSVAVNLENMNNIYLYGQDTVPINVEDRLRSGPEINQISIVDLDSYMGALGQYAQPSRAGVVNEFFTGQISRDLGNVDEAGVSRLSLAAYGASMRLTDPTWGGDIFSVSQYVTDIGASDWATRAYIWGSTSFKLDGSAILVWAADGTLSIENLAAIPFNDNFDLTSDDPIATAFNAVAQPILDPYGIARTIDLQFTAIDKLNWIASHATTYSLGDFDGDVLQVSAQTVTPSVAGFFAAADDVMDSLYTAAIAAYVDDSGRNIIYGTSGDDTIGPADLVWGSHLPSVPDGQMVFVGGDGDDILTGSEADDILYGGSGDDQINAILGSDAVYGGSGDDSIVANNAARVFGGADSDTIAISGADAGGEGWYEGGTGDDHFIVGENQGRLTFEFHAGDGNDQISNEFGFDEDNRCVIHNYSDPSLWDVSLEFLSNTYLSGDPDQSQWDVWANIRLSSGSDSIIVENVRLVFGISGSTFDPDRAMNLWSYGLSFDNGSDITEFVTGNNTPFASVSYDGWT